ncbi:hypothetical protein SAMN04487996_11318 [Dyadobacter soli]|uniref:Uncharacterized protein n=1 Tax=Dyadobacter soli TaxID=659014 RepID=A0A1G7PI63_9BACT|nr:hypothetical protein [Dyadobacter soli]SDF85921.1 hypothetical protein SAMN04487996_11318 [Dyadobacter soli]
MKAFTTIAFAILFFIAVWTERRDTEGTINPIIGDISFEKKYGTAPNADTDDQLRIAAHLEYAEKELRMRDVSQLSAKMRIKRAQMLDLLHEYWSAGLFPKNYKHEGRKPCFIDQNGTICAVGYLIEQTADRATAEDINSRNQYATILEMNDKKVDDWISQSGLSKEECAMIQPGYNYIPDYKPEIKPAYAITSSILIGLNGTSSVINAVEVGKGSRTNATPVLGIVGGAGQFIAGAVGFNRKNQVDGASGTWYAGKTQRNVSMVNMGLGSLSIGLSIWNLAVNNKPISRRSAWDVRSFPDANGKSGVALSFTHKF